MVQTRVEREDCEGAGEPRMPDRAVAGLYQRERGEIEPSRGRDF